MKTSMRTLTQELRPLFAVSIALMLLTALVYPMVVTGIGQAFFDRQASGSLVKVDGLTVGSSLIGQVFEGEGYFHGRPSAAGDGYDAASSSGSNLGPTSDKLINGVEDDPSTPDLDESFPGLAQRALAYRDENGLAADAVLPADAVTASGSGLDPHISPANARLQVRRVAAARGASESDIAALVDAATDNARFGFIGAERVNVLALNISLDNRYPLGE